MSDRVDSAFDAYVAAFKAGEVDPNPWLDRVEGVEREELVFLIDAFLEEAPVPEYDELTFEASGSRELAAAVTAGVSGRSGQWPVLLPRLRDEAKLSREAVTSGLAAALDAEGSEAVKVADYYHDMEWGSLPAQGVSDRVLEALAKVCRTTAETLREAGRQLGPGSPGHGGEVFARQPSDADHQATGDADYQATGDADRSPVSRAAEPPDRTDRLFTASG